MLGTLDEGQSLAIIEALVSAEGEKVMALVEQVAVHGGDWDTLLIDMLELLHQLAMLQLLPTLSNNYPAATELRKLAQRLPPEDIQLYYQTLLVGRKELVYAPDRRMGVEMSLLRALAFHPKANVSPPQVVSEVMPSMADASKKQGLSLPDVASETVIPAKDKSAVRVPAETAAQILQARTELLMQRGALQQKKSQRVMPSPSGNNGAALAPSPPPQRAAVTQFEQHYLPDNVVKAADKKQATVTENSKKEAYRWRAQHPEITTEQAVTPQALRLALQHEKTPGLSAKLNEEAAKRDAWAAEITRLVLPKLVQQLALNAFKQQTDSGDICLHLRSAQRHLNSSSAQKTLGDALSKLYGSTVKLRIVEDDNPAEKTPLEWRQEIYQEKLANARHAVIADSNIQTLLKFFDAELDEQSIQPL